MNIVHFKRRVIPAHAIDRCCDCLDFKEFGAAYQDGNTCEHGMGGYDTVTGDAIPDWCPRLKEKTK